MEGLKRTLGPEHPDALEAMTSLCVTLRQQGKRKEAKRLERQAEQLRAAAAVSGGATPERPGAARGPLVLVR